MSVKVNRWPNYPLVNRSARLRVGKTESSSQDNGANRRVSEAGRYVKLRERERERERDRYDWRRPSSFVMGNQCARGSALSDGESASEGLAGILRSKDHCATAATEQV